MKHDKLMKYPKRFCVECDSEQFVFAKIHKTFSMYHCRRCNSEVARAGDGQQASRAKRVAGGIDVNSFSGSFLGGKSSEVLASEYPDVLSDDHRVWPQRDFDQEAEREDRLRTFKLALMNLTPRQAQILNAVDIYGTHERAGVALRLSREAVTKTIEQIKIKLAKHTTRTGEEGLQGDGAV